MRRPRPGIASPKGSPSVTRSSTSTVAARAAATLSREPLFRREEKYGPNPLHTGSVVRTKVDRSAALMIHATGASKTDVDAIQRAAAGRRRLENVGYDARGV